MKTTSKIGLPPQIFCPPPPLKKVPEIVLMTSHPDSHMTTDVKPDMLSGVRTGNGILRDRYDIRGIAHAHTNRKDHIFMQRRLGQIFTYILKWGQGTCTLTKQTQRWTYSALRYFIRAKMSYWLTLGFKIFLQGSSFPFA